MNVFDINILFLKLLKISTYSLPTIVMTYPIENKYSKFSSQTEQFKKKTSNVNFFIRKPLIFLILSYKEINVKLTLYEVVYTEKL